MEKGEDKKKRREREWRDRSRGERETQRCELMVKAARKPIELFACLAKQRQKQQIISGFCLFSCQCREYSKLPTILYLCLSYSKRIRLEFRLKTNPG